MPMAQIAAGHFEPDTVSDGRKILVNLYTEENPTDAARTLRHMMRPGSRDRDTTNAITANVRGVGQADGHAGGKVLVVDGVTVRTFDTDLNTFSALTGNVAGSDAVQFAFSEVEAAILAGGNLFVSTGAAVAGVSDADWATLLSDHGETAVTGIASIGQRVIATYGNRFAYSDTLDFNNTTTLNFYTAESSPDALIGCQVLSGRLYLFGTETIELWVQTGNNDDPFRPQTGSVIQRGCLSAQTIEKLDNTIFFVGDDYTVRRINGLVAQIVSQPWVTRALRRENKADLIASTMEIDNHTFYILNGKLGCYVFDLSTNLWTKWQTYNKNSYDWAYVIEAAGNHYAGSREDGRFAELSRSFLSDYQSDATTFGTEIVLEFSAHLPTLGGRGPIPSIRIDGTKGRGSSADVNQEAIIEMRLSKDDGNTWGDWRPRSSGRQGQYGRRVIWRQNGRAREPQVIAHFRTNDPHLITGVAVGED